MEAETPTPDENMRPKHSTSTAGAVFAGHATHEPFTMKIKMYYSCLHLASVGVPFLFPIPVLYLNVYPDPFILRTMKRRTTTVKNQ